MNTILTKEEFSSVIQKALDSVNNEQKAIGERVANERAAFESWIDAQSGQPNLWAVWQARAALQKPVEQSKFGIIEEIAQWLEKQRNDIPTSGEEFAAALRARLKNPVDDSCPYCQGTAGHWEGCKAPVQKPVERVAVPEWISINDRLPKSSEFVLVWKKFNVRDRAEEYYTSDQPGKYLVMDGVTHWMPLPAAPSVEVES